MSNFPYHPAPGLGELLPGFFVVPQNPITAARQGVGYIPRMGELLPASFTVPQNPIVKNFHSNMGGLGGCPTGNCGGFTGALAGPVGMGELDMSDFNPSNWTMNTWMIAGGVAILLILMSRPGGSEYKAAMSQARADYNKQVAGIRRRYKRVGQRVGKAAARSVRSWAGEE